MKFFFPLLFLQIYGAQTGWKINHKLLKMNHGYIEIRIDFCKKKMTFLKTIMFLINHNSVQTQSSEAS